MKPAKLCAVVTAATMAELRTRRDQVKDADIVELRLDTVRRLAGVADARAAHPRGVLRGSPEAPHFSAALG